MYVGKYIIEQNIMLRETYLAGQKRPVTSQVVYTLFIETAANYGSVYSCFFSFNILFQKQFFFVPSNLQMITNKLISFEAGSSIHLVNNRRSFVRFESSLFSFLCIISAYASLRWVVLYDCRCLVFSKGGNISIGPFPIALVKSLKSAGKNG